MPTSFNSKSSSIIKYCLLFFILTNGSFAFGQDKLMENWETELTKVKGQDRIDLMVKLTKVLIREDFLMADSLAKEGINLAKQVGDSISIHRIGANLGELYFTMNKLDKGIEWTQKSYNYFAQNKTLRVDEAKCQLGLTLLYLRKGMFAKADSLITESDTYFRNTNDLFLKSKFLAIQGLMYMFRKEYKKSINYYMEALNISKNLDDFDYQVLLMSIIGQVKSFQGFYPEALELQLRASKMNCSTYAKVYCYQHIGQLYLDLGDWELAEKYLKMAIGFGKKLGYHNGVISNYYYLGLLNSKQLNYGTALKYYEQSIALSKTHKLYENIAPALREMGNIYCALGESEKGEGYYDKYQELVKVQNLWTEVYLFNYGQGVCAKKSKRYNDALKYTLRSYNIAQEKEHLKYLMKTNELLSEIYQGLKNSQKSTYHLEQFRFYQDRVIGLQKIKKIGALEQKYLAKPQQGSINLVNQDVTTNQEKEVFNGLKIVLGLGLLVLLSFLFFKKNRTQENISTVNPSNDQAKMNQYFEEMVTQFVQNKAATKTNNNQTLQPQSPPINDMAEFLKTNLNAPNDWVSFEHYFERVHKDFFKNLKSIYPNITIKEMNMCALLKLNLLNKDIAQIMGISHDSVRKTQSRLSKKIELPASQTLRDLVLTI